MALYAKYEYKLDDETITIIAAEIGKCVKDAIEIIRAAIDSTHYTDFYRKYADGDGESTAEDVTVDITSNPEGLFSNSGRQKHLINVPALFWGFCRKRRDSHKNYQNVSIKNYQIYP